MICLPDVNVWIALTSDRHVHHPAAKSWLDGARDRQLVFCRITEMGFLRLLTNAAVMGEDVLTPQQAWTVYDTWRADERVFFLPEPAGFSAAWRRVSQWIAGGPNAWTDAYLATFAHAVSAGVTTFDRRFPAMDGCKVEVLPTSAI